MEFIKPWLVQFTVVYVEDSDSAVCKLTIKGSRTCVTKTSHISWPETESQSTSTETTWIVNATVAKILA